MKVCQKCGSLSPISPCEWCANRQRQAEGFCGTPKDGKFCYLKKDHKGKCHVRRDSK